MKVKENSTFGYLFFHFNIAFSAIEEEEYLNVIEKCYFPVLHIAQNLKIPIGIELTGYTLETISLLRPDWVLLCKKLISQNLIGIIGSGYCQVIAPLAPSEVNTFNLKEGFRVYKKILGVTPSIFLVNEQAFSNGLVELYKENNIQNIIIEAENVFLDKKYNPEWKFHKQIAIDDHNNHINVIWNSSLFFQKFQRYAHGEIEISEYLNFIQSNFGNGRTIPLYSSDIETFNFRPGRFEVETVIEADEWQRIECLLRKLKGMEGFEIRSIDHILTIESNSHSSNRLRLASIKNPIVVKKQAKYNIIRWALSGRSDFIINTQCWKAFKALRKSANYLRSDWRELCYLWSSDFRTHITNKKWEKFQQRLNKFLSKIVSDEYNVCDDIKNMKLLKNIDNLPSYIEIKQNLVIISGKDFRVALNLNRGLTIEYFKDLDNDDLTIYGKLNHGHFNDINWLADFYTGHLIIDINARKKITDLVKVSPLFTVQNDGVNFSFIHQTSNIKIEKSVFINFDTGDVTIAYNLKTDGTFDGVIRCGYVNLSPELLAQASNAKIIVENGGLKPEVHVIGKENFDHGKPVSRSVTAQTGLGLTNGVLNISTGEHEICLEFDTAENAFCGFLQNENIGNDPFIRMYLSAQEVDETYRNRGPQELNLKYNITVRRTL